MKKTLATIRSQSPKFRMMLALGCALVITASIAAGWVVVSLQRVPSQKKPSGESPLSTIVDNVTSVVSQKKTTIQVIDVDAQVQPTATTPSYQVTP